MMAYAPDGLYPVTYPVTCKACDGEPDGCVPCGDAGEVCQECELSVNDCSCRTSGMRHHVAAVTDAVAALGVARSVANEYARNAIQCSLSSFYDCARRGGLSEQVANAAWRAADLRLARLGRRPTTTAPPTDQQLQAWLIDRAEQYVDSSASRAALYMLADRVRTGEHRAAIAHGEIDDLILS